MPKSFNDVELQEIPSQLSAPRFQRYLDEKKQDIREALALYRWNAQVSAAIMFPLQVCEVSIRNGIADAIENFYGADWPYNNSFRRSLPNPQKWFSPRRELISQANQQTTTGKIISELKFVFWVGMMTSRHHTVIWDSTIEAIFPGKTDLSKTVLREAVWKKLDKIRKFRNRVAHHEPIYERPPQDDYREIIELIRWRSPITAGWVERVQTVTDLLVIRP